MLMFIRPYARPHIYVNMCLFIYIFMCAVKRLYSRYLASMMADISFANSMIESVEALS